MTSRVEHYLKLLLENPDKWVRVTKRKNQATRQTNENERAQVIGDIKTALDVMGIRYDQQQSTKFRVWSDEAIKAEEAAKTLTPVSMVVDFSTQMSKLAIKRPESLATLSYGRQSGKSTLFKELIKFKEYKALEDDRMDAAVLYGHRPPTKD